MKLGFSLLFGISLASSIHAAGPLGYAPAPNDAYWLEMWHLENISTNAIRRGVDVNARGAWSMTRGNGVNIAIVDDGVELEHPDLRNQAAAGLHWNFESDTPNGQHPTTEFQHGTAIAGMAAAQGGNGRGVIGVAPEAKFASWVIFRTNGTVASPFVSAEQRAKMFGFQNQAVQVQNHSWVTPGANFVDMSAAEHASISNAVTLGREGKGVVMVRAAGNNRVVPTPRNVNEDLYASDPRAITVAAVRYDGRVASYSTPGAAILVAAPSGDPTGLPSPWSTDRTSGKGFNRINFSTDLDEYVWGSFWFGGTSSAAPLISGIAALLLSASPELGYRDVQQILIHAAYQPDIADPGVVENGAGFSVSHNTGFGLVNAGTAVDLARRWINRPTMVATAASANLSAPRSIPDAGLYVLVETAEGLVGITALPSLGLFPDEGSRLLPMVSAGRALEPITEDLRGKGALIQRGGGTFSEKIENAQNAGAEFAVVFNNQGDTQLEVMGSTDFVRIPAVFISQRDGAELAGLLAGGGVQAQLLYQRALIPVAVQDTLLCEHVSVRLDWEHEQRGDVRVTLVSPAGTRSVMQRLSDVTTPYSGFWTYTSTHHFYESSKGTWVIEVGDVVAGGTGMVRQAALEIRGAAIEDSDADGLDDSWETQRLGSLEHGPKDDPDGDGYSNAREQILGTDPNSSDHRLEMAVANWGGGFVRLNWASKPGVQYEVLGYTEIGQAPAVLATITGGFPRSAWFGKADERHRFFQVRQNP